MCKETSVTAPPPTSLTASGSNDGTTLSPQESNGNVANNNNDSSSRNGGPPLDFKYLGVTCPHAARRKEILSKYPQIQELYGPDWRLVPWSLLLVAIQVTLAVRAPSMSWPVFWACAYLIGGVTSHAMSLAGHELSHNLGFQKPLYNEILAIVVNLGQGVASGATFKRYHLEHHYFQGSDIDTDIPSKWEVQTFTGSQIQKIVWLWLQPWMYAFRPLIVNPKDLSRMELINAVVVYGFDLFLIHKYGIWSVLYFIASLWCGMSFHPVAGHFISEHYTLNPDSIQETFSYYGVLNNVCFNVGYHNEHHDFPRISGFNLPKVRAIAPEYYDERWKVDSEGTPMTYYDSWTRVLIEYVTNPRVGPASRIRRIPGSRKLGKGSITKMDSKTE